MSSPLLIKQSAEPLTGAHSPQGKEKVKTRKVYPRLFSKQSVLSFCAKLDYSEKDAINHAIVSLGKFFDYLGMGSGRLVYQYDNNSVIKFAMNKGGAAQNTKEAHVASRSSLMAKIFDIAPNSSYIIVEKITPFSDEVEFENATGLSENITDALRDRGLKGESQFFRLTPKDLSLLQDVQFMSKLGAEPLSQNSAELLVKMLDVARHNNLVSADLFKFNSWGTDSKGKLKCLDYGFGVGAEQFGMNTRVVFEGGKPEAAQSEPFVDLPYVEPKHELREGLFNALPKYEALFNMCKMFHKVAGLIDIREFDMNIYGMVKKFTDAIVQMQIKDPEKLSTFEYDLEKSGDYHFVGREIIKINN